MSKGGIAVLVVAALVFAALGFVFGQIVQASVDTGSQDNPVVTKQFVETYVGERLAAMQTKIDELEEQLLAASNGSAGTTPTIPEPGNNSDGNGDNSSDTPPTSSFSKVTVKDSSVNVRSDASTEASIVGNVSAGTELTFLGQKNDSDGRVWYKVRMEGNQEGWIASWLCYEPQ